MSDIEKAVEGGAEFTANQQAQAAQEAADEAARAAAAATPCDTSDDGIRSRGGYMLNDPQWTPGGPWGGLPPEEMETEQNRRYAIVEMMKTGTAFGFTKDFSSLDPFATDLGGYFPASQAGRANLEAREGDARLNYAMDVGNQLATCLADPAFYVASIADAG